MSSAMTRSVKKKKEEEKGGEEEEQKANAPKPVVQ